MLICRSKILYIRASLAPVARQIKKYNGVLNFLHSKIDFDEILTPYFHGPRPFWRPTPIPGTLKKSNSGALGRLIANTPGSIVSSHPTHSFAGLGGRVEEILSKHTLENPCFSPIHELTKSPDFSMLLLGCLKESPGFSTVHVAQNILGLSQRHLVRYLLRWDIDINGVVHSKVAPESPGCSASFDKFYPYYEQDSNFLRGDWEGVNWIFVPSARQALKRELDILKKEPRFVNCGKWFCPTCSFRLY